jgi:hypothetical protein
VRTALAAGAPSAWRQAWRAIFHARIHEALDRARAGARRGARSASTTSARLAFDEMRLVLRQEDLLLPPADDHHAYVEFVALYLELRHFAPRTLARDLLGARRDRRAHRRDDRRRRRRRGAAHRGAPAPGAARGQPRRRWRGADRSTRAERRAVTVVFGERALKNAAAAARAKGNHVRAALLAVRTGDSVAARADLDALVVRLSRALGGVPTDGWAEALLPLAELAATQSVLRYTPGARLLLALQAACTDGERDVEVVDVASWIRSRGRRAAVRTLPATREVRVARQIRAAARQVAHVEAPSEAAHDRVADVIHAAVEHANHRVRVVLRPVIEETLEEVGLVPRHLPARVAQKKLVDELLDRAVAVGRLSLGDLRDAIAHNDLKLPDLGLRGLAQGDQLLRADRLLATSLDGVYRRGEIYLRFLQKVSSVLSGTSLGRLLSLYVLLPIVGSYFVVEGAHHMAAPVAKLAGSHPPDIATRPVLLGMAVFVFLLLHAGWFRAVMLAAVRGLGRGLKLVFYDTAVRLGRVRALRLAMRWLILPGIPAALAVLFIPGRRALADRRRDLRDDRRAHQLRRRRGGGERLAPALEPAPGAQRILPGLVKYSLEFFGWTIELIERGIYRVDEALRFRPNQSRRMAIVKGVLATIWFAVAYVLRIYVNLLIEPTVNPVKHFPVVTVAAKLILPFLPQLTAAIADPVGAVVGPTLGASFAAFTVLVLPGIAGFLAWELNSNWKLYQRQPSAECCSRREDRQPRRDDGRAACGPASTPARCPSCSRGCAVRPGRATSAAWPRPARASTTSPTRSRKFADRQLVAVLNRRPDRSAPPTSRMRTSRSAPTACASTSRAVRASDRAWPPSRSRSSPGGCWRASRSPAGWRRSTPRSAGSRRSRWPGSTSWPASTWCASSSRRCWRRAACPARRTTSPTIAWWCGRAPASTSS